MIDFKDKDELPTNLVICGSLAVMIVAGLCLKLLPLSKAPSSRDESRERTKIQNETADIKTTIVTERASLATYTWPGRPEDIAPIALKQVNGLLLNRHLKLAGFHAQKPIEQPNITLVPFVVSVDGGFLNVMAFAHDLERTGTKLVVNLFQMSNADQSTDKVTASIGITAYQLPVPPDDSDTTTKVEVTSVKGAVKSSTVKTVPVKPARSVKGVKIHA